MFTGLVEEIGTVQSVTPKGGVVHITIHANKVMDDLKVDDSINISGVCQTVVQRTKDTLTVQAIKETIKKTNFRNFKKGSKVNLERSLLPTSRMGGHFVQGHVDGVGRVKSVLKKPGDWKINIDFPIEFMKYIIPVGSICVEGVSLTVAEVKRNEITVAIIPHTLEVTTLGSLKSGDIVNIELDMIGKYIVHLYQETGTKS